MLSSSSFKKQTEKKSSFRLFYAETILRIKNHAVKREAFSSTEGFMKEFKE